MTFARYLLTLSLASGSLILPAFAQQIEHEKFISFEEGTLSSKFNVPDGQLVLSKKHAKAGIQSAEWSFGPGGSLSLMQPIPFEPQDPTGKDTYLSTFVIWIYNENPLAGEIRFEFLKDGRTCCGFPFAANFKGWRAAWVCFERDMEGIPEEGMNEVRITAPDKAGKLYFDHMILATKTDHRYQTPDKQVPFVNKHTRNHWLQLLNHSMVQPDIALESQVTAMQKEDIRTIEERLNALIYTSGKYSQKEKEQINKDFDFYQIRKNGDQIRGKSVYFGRAAEAFERIIPDTWRSTYPGEIELSRYFNLMNRIACAYHNAQNENDKKELREKFLLLHEHITDQGIAEGSCMGNFTHYGYSFRGYYPAMFLMRDVLKETGQLEQAQNAVRWYAGTQDLFTAPVGNGIDMDSFNTLTTGRIASILMMEDSPEKVRLLKAFARWIDYGCRPAEGLADAFKPDGSAYHHCNNYPAYAVGGLTGATNMIYLLSRTGFAISEEAHQTVKQSLLAMRFYCNKKHFPIAMSGRHPDGMGALVPIHFATMGIAGTPDGKEVYDHDMAAAYLRLISESGNKSEEQPEYMPAAKKEQEKRMSTTFQQAGIQPEADPNGHLSLGYACVNVHRRKNWAAVIKGHSRYLWAAEHYLGANLYGRYLSHGSMQLLTSTDGKTVTPATGGWQEAGFDWGRIPGTTAIHLPVEQLKANILNVDKYSGFEEMLYSDEAFAGGLAQDGNGIFAMKLHEHDKYGNGSHRARKSFHCFGDKIICLGSGIENDNSRYDTETTLFQTALTPDTKDTECKTDRKNVFRDLAGNGYYIPGKTDRLKLEKNYPQSSLNEETSKPTQGNWVSLVMNHGKSPKNAHYEYMVTPGSTPSPAICKSYRVLQQNDQAHIVQDLADKNNIRTSFALFEKADNLPGNTIEKADTACLVMVAEAKDGILLTLSNPDMAFYRGEADDIFDAQGKRIERSIYSRPWIGNPSMEIPVEITLKGAWLPASGSAFELVKQDRKTTTLRVKCKEGTDYTVQLRKK